MTWERSRFLDRVGRSGLWAADYAEDVLVRLAHSSSSIEGNTLTVSDTFTLLLDDIAPAGKSMRELYEVANHREALGIVLDAVTEDRPLETELVREVHAALTDHLLFDRGEYKNSENRVAGASFLPVPPSQVPQAMMQWAQQTEWQTASLDDMALIEAIAQSHISFERIHPFSDGNGRAGRMILAYQTIRRFGYPAMVPVEQKSAYIRALDEQDAAGLSRMLLRSLAAESARVVVPPTAPPPVL